jgi:hypothetical protein
MIGSSACMDSLHAFAAKAFADWRGLLSPCLIEDALHILMPQDEWIGTGSLGSDALAASYRFCRVPSYPAPVRVWFADSEVRLIEAEGPLESLSFAQLTRQLGEPEARLDSWYGFAAVEKGEWVYAARGIAVSCGPSGREVSRLYVFAPISVQDYVQDVRINQRQRPLPPARKS